MAQLKSRVRRVAIHLRDQDPSAVVVRGVGFRYICDCGEQGSVRASWAEASADKREHIAGHRAE